MKIAEFNLMVFSSELYTLFEKGVKKIGEMGMFHDLI